MVVSIARTHGKVDGENPVNNKQHIHKSEPSEFLVDNLHLLPRGKVLDIAMGQGRNAIYLAKMGFDVEGIDISQENVDAALRNARENNVSIKAVTADLEGDYYVKLNYYDVIICFNYLQRTLIPSIRNGLRRGGVVVYETFTVEQPKLFGKPRNPYFLLKHNELLEMFQPLRCLRYREGVVDNKKAVASLVARKESNRNLSYMRL